MGSLYGRVETSTKVIMTTMSVTVMEKCFGLTVQSIKESGEMEFNMGKGKQYYLTGQKKTDFM
jgi:hypothetical protein